MSVFDVGIDSTAPNAVLKEGKQEGKQSVGSPTQQSYSRNAVSTLNEYSQKNGLPPPNYEYERPGEQEFIFTVAFLGETYKGSRKSSIKDAKQAAAQTVIDTLKI